MSRSSFLSFAVVIVVCASVTMTACGGGTSEEVARVGDTAITRAAVSHWMNTLIGGDYYQVSRKRTVPTGLVSDPPNYRGCVARLESIAASSPSRRPKPTGLQLLTKCRELYQAMKKQAISYLVTAQWAIALDREQGITASDQEIRQLLKEVKAREYPKKGQFEQYLAATRATLSDELFVVKLDVLTQKLLNKVGAGGQKVNAAFTKEGEKWTAKTTCRPGYVVEHCRQYKGEPTPAPTSPSILLEQVAELVTGQCANLPACAEP